MVLEGDLQIRACKLIHEWASQYQRELTFMWENKEYKKLPGLE